MAPAGAPSPLVLAVGRVGAAQEATVAVGGA